MGNSNSRVESKSQVDSEKLPRAIPLLIPVVESRPLYKCNSIYSECDNEPSAPPFDMQFTPSAPPTSELETETSVIFRMLSNAIVSNRKNMARDAIEYNTLTPEELYTCLNSLDSLQKKYPKNKTRPIIREMIVAKLNEINDKDAIGELRNMLNVIEEEIERNPEDKMKQTIHLILLEKINKKQLNLY